MKPQNQFAPAMTQCPCIPAQGRRPWRPSWRSLRPATLLALGLCLGVLPAGAAFAQSLLVPYGASGYRYSVVTGDFPSGAEAADFDDRAFDVGAAPFGEPDPGCPISPVTEWPGSTNLIARMHFTLERTPVGATLHVAINNDVTIYVNDVLVASLTHESCAQYDDFNIPIPDGILHTGQNLIAALAVDRGVVARFDVMLSAVAVPPANLYELKLMYRH